MSTPSDPQRGGQQPDDTADAGPERGESGHPGQRAGDHPQPGGYGDPPGQYGGQPYGGQYGQYPPGQYGQQYAPGHPPYGQPSQPGPAPQPGQAPQYGGQYGANPPYGQPGGYGNQPYNPYGTQPYGAADSQGAYAYSPYGTPPPYPAGLDDGGVSAAPRPGVMAGALVMLILSALPFLAVGVLMVIAIGSNVLPPEILDDPRLAEAGVTPDLLVTAVQVAGGLMAVLALLYVIFAVLAFRGRNWARILVTVMTVGFTLLLLSGLFTGTTGDASGLVVLLVIIVLSVGGTVLMYMPAAARFFAHPRG